jgi:transcriptional regulator with XRE-family HTH domain
MSQQQLAAAAGMSRNFVSSIERGAHGVDVLRLLRLAAALDVGLVDLVDLVVDGSDPARPAASVSRL